MKTTTLVFLEELNLERARLLNGAVLAESTQECYRQDWLMFCDWCRNAGKTHLPASPDTVSLYLTHTLQSGKKINTARRRIAVIGHMHRAHSLPSPLSEETCGVLRGARRLRCEHLRQMKPLSMVFGFASALRSASLAALRLEDIDFCADGLTIRIHVHREKQDQTGRGRLIGIPHGKHPDTCAIRCLEDWMKHRGLKAGPLFMQVQDRGTIRRIVQRSLERIGKSSEEYGSHSLRAGFVTAAGEAGLGELLIASQTGHKSMEVLRRYFRRQTVFRSNACALLDL